MTTRLNKMYPSVKKAKRDKSEMVAEVLSDSWPLRCALITACTSTPIRSVELIFSLSVMDVFSSGFSVSEWTKACWKDTWKAIFCPLLIQRVIFSLLFFFFINHSLSFLPTSNSRRCCCCNRERDTEEMVSEESAHMHVPWAGGCTCSGQWETRPRRFCDVEAIKQVKGLCMTRLIHSYIRRGGYSKSDQTVLLCLAFHTRYSHLFLSLKTKRCVWVMTAQQHTHDEHSANTSACNLCSLMSNHSTTYLKLNQTLRW